MGSDDRTSSEKFREGDVVLCTPQDVAGVSSGAPFEGVVEYWGGGLNVLIVDHGHWGQRAIRLLRRPVRAGDRVRGSAEHPNMDVRGRHELWTGIVIDVASDGRLEFGTSPSERILRDWRHYEHVDGTPIEPPQVKAPELADRPPPVASPGLNVHDRALARVTQERDQARLQLADQKTINGEQLQDLYEQRAEVAWLKRELRRLDPRLYRARYERSGR